MLDGKIGIIGLGNMGSALAQGLKEADVFPASDVFIFDIDKNRLNTLSQKLGFTKASSNQALVAKSQGIILAVKPKDVAKVLEETKKNWTDDKYLISIAAGITISFLERKVNQPLPIIRAMPNTPGQIGAGITAFSLGKSGEAQHKEIARKIFRTLGEVVEVDEEAMDLVTALSGSGPAYFFLIMEALVETGQGLGLKKNLVQTLVKETAWGAAKLARSRSESLSQLRKKVTSPGGTTEAALKVFEKFQLKKIIFEAVEAAKNKSKELSQD